ncbi:MAG: hypothetical protein ACE14M_04260 [Terriglobales bacterium]
MGIIITIGAVSLFSFSFALLLECVLLKSLFHFLVSVPVTADELSAAQSAPADTARPERRSTVHQAPIA